MGSLNKQVTIPNGESESNYVDTNGLLLMAIQMPAAWTAAVITIKAQAAQGLPFRNVYDELGTERALTVAAGSFVQFDPPLCADKFILRSGTSGSPVEQEGDREIILVLLG